MESAQFLKRIVRTIEKQEWLESWSNFVENKIVIGAYGKLGERQWPIRNVLHGSFLGHPFHSAISDLPIGAWATAFVLDTADTLFGKRELGPGADAAVGLGLASVPLAAVSGLADWKHTKEETQHVGLAHALTNVAASGCYLSSLLCRRSGARGLGQVFSTAGFGLVLAGAYLGGELVFDRKVAITRAEEPAEPEEFTPISALDDLEEGAPYRFNVDGTPIVVVRSGQNAYALSDVCSHLGRSLAGGEVHNGNIMCPAHSSTFKLEDGTVVHGPAAYPQPTFDVRIREGQIEVRRPG